MKLYQRKRRVAAANYPAPTGPYEAMSHEQLVQIGRDAGLPPFCGTWPRETLIANIEKAKSNG
ncbi:hypothetical protein [Kordiimonas sp.]|uniref:hypothetical protein n=1 Tax=Kordiimonas sp. TaxID=1970157 RepID=UPI003A94F0BF